MAGYFISVSYYRIFLICFWKRNNVTMLQVSSELLLKNFDHPQVQWGSVWKQIDTHMVNIKEQLVYNNLISICKYKC